MEIQARSISGIKPIWEVTLAPKPTISIINQNPQSATDCRNIGTSLLEFQQISSSEMVRECRLEIRYKRRRPDRPLSSVLDMYIPGK